MSLITYGPVPYLPTYTFQELKSPLLTKAATRVKFGQNAGALVFPSVVTRCRAAGARAVHAESLHPSAAAPASQHQLSAPTTSPHYCMRSSGTESR